jgi:nitric oxide reductase subunit C
MTAMMGIDRAVSILIAVLLVGGLCACGPAAADDLSKRDARMVDLGIEVYQTQRCGSCHTLTRAGTTGIFGPPHDSLAAVAQLRIQDPNYHGAATSAEEYIRESIADPGAFRAPGYTRTHFPMPDYSGLAPEDLEALVFMLSRTPE